MSPLAELFLQLLAVLTPILVVAVVAWTKKILNKYGLLEHDPETLISEVKDLRETVKLLKIVATAQHSQLVKGSMLSDRDTSLIHELRSLLLEVKKKITPPNTPLVAATTADQPTSSENGSDWVS